MEPHELIFAVTNAGVAARCLHVVAELGVADHIDDHPVSAQLDLTTVRQDFWELGRRAMVLVERVLAGEENASVDLVPTTLIVRASTAPPPPSP